MLFGILYLLFLTISLFWNSIEAPLACMIANLIVYQGDIGDVLKADPENWTVIAFKITGFVCAVIFILLGTYIAYYKSVVKVDTMRQIRNASFYCLLGFCTIGVIHSVFVIVYSVRLDVDFKDEKDSRYDLDKKRFLAILMTVTLQLLVVFSEIMLFALTYRIVRRIFDTMMEFHDYLIAYRLTPRSRILRKHLPKMTMVLEEESNMDTSSIMMS